MVRQTTYSYDGIHVCNQLCLYALTVIPRILRTSLLRENAGVCIYVV